MRKLGKPAVEPLIQVLKDKYKEVREKAVKAVYKIGDIRAAELIIDFISYPFNIEYIIPNHDQYNHC